MDDDASLTVLRSAWVQALVRDTQVFVGAVNEVPLSSFPELVERFVVELPRPSNPAECFAARAVLLEGAVAAGSVLHRRVHGRSAHRCDFNPTEAAVGIWRHHRSSPVTFLCEWAALVRHCLGGDRQVFQQAQEWVWRHWSESHSSDEAADALGLPLPTLDRIFRSNAGLSFSKYHRGVRLATAIELLATTDLKVDVIAFEVGFRSKKNFYKAFKEWMGVTPRRFRALGLVPQNSWHDRVPATFRRRVEAAVQRRSAGGTPPLSA